MRRAWVIGSLIVLGSSVAAQSPPATTGKLADRLYEITSFAESPVGVKVLALVGPEGVLLVDSGTAGRATALRAALDRIGAGPVRYVVNTHVHGDHVGGNAALGIGAVVVAHEAVARRLTTGLALLVPQPPGTVPAITFDDSVTLRFAGEEVRVRHRPAAHTDGDATVHFVHARVVAVGDLAFPDRFPFIDTRSGGTVKGYLATLASLASGYQNGTRFVAAHGAVYSAEQVARYRAELVTMETTVRAAVAGGATVEQLKDRNLLAPWQAWAGSFVTPERFLDTLAQAARPGPGLAVASVLDRMIPALVKGSGEDAVRVYRELKAKQSHAWSFAEADVNRLGYALLAAGRAADATAILALNVEENPASWNAYDSLAEAYMTAGKRELAIANYTRSLELSPANTNAQRMLERLRMR